MQIHRRSMALAMGFALPWLSMSGLAAQRAFEAADPAGVIVPPIEPIGALTHVVRPHEIVVLNGAGTEDDISYPTAGYPLIEAILLAGPGDVLGIDGSLPGAGQQIGGGDAGQKYYRADWGLEPIDLTIVGLRPERASQITSFSLHLGRNDGQPTGGVSRIRIQNLTILSPSSDTQCIGVPIGADTGGLVQVYDVDFKGAQDGSFDGLGYKWGIRAMGRMRWDIRGVHAAPVQEHVFYLDSPAGNSYFVDCTMEGSWRTMVQIVNRRTDNPGTTGYGTLVFENMTAYNVFGEGGYAFTIAGHLGGVIFRDCRVIEGPNGSQGALVVWVDDSEPHGAHLDGDGFATGPVILDNFRVYAPNADRSHVSISGARSVHIDEFHIIGNQMAFRFRQKEYPNGKIRFLVQDPVSSYPGFAAARKVQWSPGVDLSDAEIDSLWWPQGP